MSLFSHDINASEIPHTKTAVNSDKGTHTKIIIVMIITRFELFLAATIKKLHNVCIWKVCNLQTTYVDEIEQK